MSSDLAVEQDGIWSKDKLNRKNYADFLYKVICSAQVNNDEDNALIFSIDGDWGTGKSFFINIWMQQLQKDGHLVSRFDAWKNDIIDDPLIGFISHVYSAIESWKDQLPIDDLALDAAKDKTEKILSSVKEKMLPICTEVVKGLAKKGASYLVTEEVVDFVLQNNKSADEASLIKDNAVASKLIENKILAHNKNIQVIEKFKEELSSAAYELTKALGKKGPVIIFIDELDRCRPDYAVRLLEVLKHVFNSKGICFISSANISQLEHSIKTIYGSEFNSELYLDRFFNYRLVLPKPSVGDYIRSNVHAIKYNYDFKKVFDSIVDRYNSNTHGFHLTDEFRQLNKLLDDNNNFILKICELNDFKLRDINNLLGKLSLVMGILKSQWNGMDVNHNLAFYLLAHVFKNKKSKREEFGFSSSLKKYDENNINDIKSENIVIINSKAGEEILHKVSFDDFLYALDCIYFKVHEKLMTKHKADTFHRIENVLYSSMRINGGDNIKRAKEIIDSYIDTCFMAASINSKEDVVMQ